MWSMQEAEARFTTDTDREGPGIYSLAWPLFWPFSRLTKLYSICRRKLKTITNAGFPWLCFTAFSLVRIIRFPYPASARVPRAAIALGIFMRVSKLFSLIFSLLWKRHGHLKSITRKKKSRQVSSKTCRLWSGRQDLNLRNLSLPKRARYQTSPRPEIDFLAW